MALNTRQLLFVEHYLKLNNATQAAIAAGYSAKTAKQIGSKLLTNVDITSRISERVETKLASVQMDADEVLDRMAAIARGNIGMLLNRSSADAAIDLSAPDAPLHLVKRIKTKRSDKFGDEIEVEMYDAQSALVTIGKHWRLWDRAGESDWKEEAKRRGLNPAEIFEEMVRQAANKIKQTRGG
jgi:phage terminase small subunit